MAGFTLQQLQAMGGKPVETPQSPQNKTGGLSLQQLQAMGGKPIDNGISQSQTQQPQTSQVGGGFVGDLLTGNTQRFGQTIGGALAAPSNAGKYADSMQQHTKTQNDLLRVIKTKKAANQDTSRLEEALARHMQDAPKLEDFTGDVINKTPGQIAGEGIGTGLEALSGGLVTGGAKTVAAKELSTLGKINQLGKTGTAYGAIGSGANTMAQGGGVADTLKSSLTGAAAGYGLGAGLGAAGSGISKVLGKTTPVNKAQRVADLTGEILQGKKKDVKGGIDVFKKLTKNDLSKIKTYEEGVSLFDKKIEKLSQKQDKLLEKDTVLRKGKDLALAMKVGEKTVKHNYVTDALDQLDNFYKATNNVADRSKIAQLRVKAKKTGFTTKDINEIAKLHGEKLNAFNVNGQLASGLTKQGAENTRAGLKKTVREFFGGPISKKIDRDISQNIRVRKLFNDMSENVNKLQQKIQERSVGAKVGNLIGRGINLVGLGSPKGIVEALIPRGQGFKTMNALDLEKNLQKNLKLIKELTEKNLPEGEFVKKLQAFLKEVTLNKVGSESKKANPTMGKIAGIANKQGGFTKTGVSASGAALTGLTALSRIPSTETYEKQKINNTDENKKTVDNFLKGIAYNETRGVSNPYSFRKPSGSKALGDDLGKYQVTEGELKTYGKRYLGYVPTAEQFIASPELQDTYMKNKYAYLLSQGFSPSEIADIHRKGIKNARPQGAGTYQSPEYVESFNSQFNKNG